MIARLVALTFALAMLSASALAQEANHVEPWRPLDSQAAARAGANGGRVTSGLAATGPTVAEQRRARALASAVFAKPAAGKRAADRAAPLAVPDWAAAQGKPNMAPQPDITPDADGLKLIMPF